MIDLDRDSLDRVLPTTAGPADWDDVLTRFRVHRRRRRRRFAVLAVAALVVAGGTATAFGSVRDFFLDRGFVGLPPIQATRSAPERGQLVVSFRARSMDGRLTEVFVYADGRVIRQREGGAPGGANELTSGFLEQHLNRHGVELLRSEVTATGLFDHDASLVSDRGLAGTIKARIGERLLSVSWINTAYAAERRKNGEKYAGTTATPAKERALERLDALLTDPGAWLPASAWQDEKARAYVASRYAACVRGEPDRIIALLPKPADELLGAREFEPAPYAAHSEDYCAELTTDEARALAKAFDEAGLAHIEESHRLAYSLKLPGPAPETVRLSFEPRLPSGEFTCTPCG